MSDDSRHAVGYVVSTLRNTGPTRQLFNLVRRIDSSRFVPYVLTLSPEGVHSLWSEFEEAGIQIESLGFSRLTALYQARTGLKQWVSANNIELLHTQGVRADALASRLTEWPRVATLRNTPFLDYPMAYGPVGRVLAWYHLRVLRRVDQVVVVSNASRSVLAELNLSPKVVCNGVDVDWFNPVEGPEEKAQLRRKLSLSDGPVVVTTGRLSQRKNHAVVVDAVRQVPSAELVIVGEGECRESLAEMCGDDTRFRLVGRQEDVRPWLRAADVFVSTSRAEGLPNSVMEALACGLPCVLSDIPPHREMSEAAASCIQLVDGESDPAVAQGLRSMLDGVGPRALQARSLAFRSFNSDSTAQGYQQIYSDVLAGAEGKARNVVDGV